MKGYADNSFIEESASKNIERLNHKANLVTGYLDDVAVDPSHINNELYDFFSFAELLGTSPLADSSATRYSGIIAMVNAHLESKLQESQHLRKLIDARVSEKMIFMGALAVAREAPASVPFVALTTKGTGQGANRVITRTPEEQKMMEYYVRWDLICGGVGKLLEMNGIHIKKPEELFDMERLKRTGTNLDNRVFTKPENSEALKQLLKVFLEGRIATENMDMRNPDFALSEAKRILGPDFSSTLSPNGPESQSPVVAGLLSVHSAPIFIKEDMARALNETIFNILVQYASITNTTYLFRGVSFDTEEERSKFVEKIREEHIVPVQNHMSTTVFPEVADAFAHVRRYGVVVKLDFSKTNCRPMRYFGADSEALPVYISEGELRVDGSIPKEAVLEMQLVERENQG